MRWNFVWGLLLSSGPLLSACAVPPLTYSAEQIDARIVDSDTKKPVEGAIVIAHWVLEGGLHTDRVGELMILETVTDKSGAFHFPAWGPITHWGKGRLTDMDPQLIIFKPGYQHQILSNALTKEAITGKYFPVRRSDWNGRTVELVPSKATAEEYAKKVYWLGRKIDSLLDFAYGDRDCNWKKVPRMLAALHVASLDVERRNIRPYGGHILRIDDIPIRTECGSPESIFQGKAL